MGRTASQSHKIPLALTRSLEIAFVKKKKKFPRYCVPIGNGSALHSLKKKNNNKHIF